MGYSDSQYRTAIGRMAPNLSIEQCDSILILDNLKGDYVLLNFWSSTDAGSRTAANLYTSWVRTHPKSDLKFVSINFDESEGLFKEIVRNDSLESSQQIRVDGRVAKAIFDNYGLDDGYGSLLIDPQGYIVAHNPDSKKLAALLK